MGMRDWLIIIVIVGIILILLDGYRRKRKDSIRVKLDKNIPPLDDDLLEAAELPNGGARVIPRGKTFDDEEYDDDYQDYDDENDDDQIVPVLMDAIELDKDLAKRDLSISSEYSEEESLEDAEDDLEEDNDWESDDYSEDDEEDAAEESTEEDDEFDIYDDEDDDDADEESLEEEDRKEISSHNSGFHHDADDGAEEDYDEDDDYEDYEDSFDDEEISSVRVKTRAEQRSASQAPIKSTGNIGKAGKSGKQRIEPTFGKMENFSEAELDDRPARTMPSQSKKQKKNTDEVPTVVQAELFSESPEDFIQNEDEHDGREDGFLEPEEVIVINVMAKKGELFAGSDLLPILMQHGMRLGSMSIFHKHAGNSDKGAVVFSMANMVKPGTFDVAQMEEFTTPGVSFFLQLPNPNGNMKSFEQMLSAADSIKASLNGDLKDEHRSVITRQTIEHCRQRIQDFELAQLSKK